MHRRNFIRYSLTTLLALNFGCSIRNLMGVEEKRSAKASTLFTFSLI